VTIEFVDSSGACSLYLIPFSDQELPSYASGQLGDFSLVAQLTDPPPANALKLGSGNVTASAFTSWTEDGNARAKVTASSVLPLANLTGLSAGDLLKYDGSSRFVPATLADLVAGTSNQIAVTDDTDGTITLSAPQDLNSGASPQFTGLELNGVPLTVSGSAPGSPSAGDLWWETGASILWEYSSDASDWLSQPFDVDLTATVALTGTATDTYLEKALRPGHNLWIDEAVAVVYGDSGTWNASNKWTAALLSVYNSGNPSLASADITSATWQRVDITPSGGSRLINTDTYLSLVVTFTKTGSPGNLIRMCASIKARFARD